jgi:hypothetical protein
MYFHDILIFYLFDLTLALLDAARHAGRVIEIVLVVIDNNFARAEVPNFWRLDV